MLQITRIDLRHKLQLLIRTCFLSDYRLLFVRFLLLTLSMWFFFCWKRHSTKIVVLLFLRYLAQQTNTYSKSAAETLKASSRDCASLLTACSMSKTLFNFFLVYTINMSLFTVMFLLLRYLFRCIYCQFYTDFTPYLLLSVISFVLSPWVQKKPPEVVFLKKCSLKLRNIFRKTPVLGSLFNKVVALQGCKYIKKRLQHRFFVRNLRKFLRTHFLKNTCKRLLL